MLFRSRHYVAELVRVLAPGGAAVLQAPSAPARRLSAVRLKTAVRRTVSAPLPGPVAAWLYRRVTGQLAPIEMYALPRDQVIALLQRSGARVVDVAADSFAGDDWISHRYLVTKV